LLTGGWLLAATRFLCGTHESNMDLTPLHAALHFCHAQKRLTHDETARSFRRLGSALTVEIRTLEQLQPAAQEAPPEPEPVPEPEPETPKRRRRRK
jgi:hypothetical protein